MFVQKQENKGTANCILPGLLLDRLDQGGSEPKTKSYRTCSQKLATEEIDVQHLNTWNIGEYRAGE